MKPHLTLSFNVSILTSLALIRFMEMHGYLPGVPEKANEACKDGGGVWIRILGTLYIHLPSQTKWAGLQTRYIVRHPNHVVSLGAALKSENRFEVSVARKRQKPGYPLDLDSHIVPKWPDTLVEEAL